MRLIFLAQSLPMPVIRSIKSPLPIEVKPTCFPERLFGRLGMSMRFNPTPMAPELTRTTLCPCLLSCTTVSTIEDKVDNSG